MADNYLEKRYEEVFGTSGRHKAAPARPGLDVLLLRNRSFRGYDKTYVVHRRQLDAMIAVKLARLDQMKARAARMAPLRPGPEEETAALEADILSDYTALTRRQRDIAAVIRAVRGVGYELEAEEHD